jgi:PKD repeat protein
MFRLHNPTTWDVAVPGCFTASSNSQNPSNICYNTAGTYPVTLTVTNQYGQSSMTQTNFITVLASPSAPTIIQNIDTLFCSANANSYQWYLGGNAIPGATNSFYVASQSGNYMVEITDSNGCYAVSLAYIFSFNITIANFSANDTSVCEGTCLDFTDLSSYNPTSWLWSFPGANPSTSSLQNPSGICYNASGIYSVTLTATNAFGQNTFSIPNYIQVFASPSPPRFRSTVIPCFA